MDESRLDIVEKELLKLKKMELVQFIMSRRLPIKLQKITVVIEFLLANESNCCYRCSNGQIMPITFYSSEKAGEDGQNSETEYYDRKPSHIWISPESTITEASYRWTGSTNELRVSEFNLKSTAGDNQSSLTSSTQTNNSVGFERSFLPGVINGMQDIKMEHVTAEELSDPDNTHIKIEYPEVNEENEAKFSTSLDKCKLTENGQIQEEDDEKATSDTKVEELFQCEMCSYKTDYKKYLTKHRISHSEARPFSCDFCKYKAKTKEQLKLHVGRHSGLKKLSCDLCDYECSSKYVLKGHMQSHTREIEFACSLCDYKTFQERLFKWHMKTHNKTAPFECTICGNTFKSRTYLKRHILQYHTRDKPFKCDSCEYTCVGENILNRHKRYVHLRERKFSCEFCDYKCFGKSTLTQHRRTHTGEKPFKCNQCNYKSAIKNMLLVHMRTHTGEKPFSCEFCEYRAAFKPHVKLHIQRVHPNEMPFSCKMCDFKSNYLKPLQKHIETHHKSVQVD